MNETQLESKLQSLSLDSPRITSDDVDSTIAKVDYHVFPNTTLTVCCITLVNGFTVTGESASASPENFNKSIGEDIAFNNARDKIWQLEGYLLKQHLHQQKESI